MSFLVLLVLVILQCTYNMLMPWMEQALSAGVSNYFDRQLLQCSWSIRLCAQSLGYRMMSKVAAELVLRTMAHGDRLGAWSNTRGIHAV